MERVITNAGVEPVYNLTVEGVPEYFANGLLVHNCDALRYAVMGALSGSGTFDYGGSQSTDGRAKAGQPQRNRAA